MNRVADVLLEPLFWAIALLALSYALRRRKPRVASALPAVVVAVLLVFGNPEVNNRLQLWLERPAATTMKKDVVYDAVIVLGGSMSPELSRETGLPTFNDTVERVLTTFDLLRTGRARNAILSGGTLPTGPSPLEPESRLVARQLVAWGIEPARLALDERSLNTHENAVESVRIARERGWTNDLLVTSAAHMPRAQGCFRREGLELDTLAVDFRGAEPAGHSIEWLPRANALAGSAGAIREAVGRLVYRARGWTR